MKTTVYSLSIAIIAIALILAVFAPNLPHLFWDCGESILVYGERLNSCVFAINPQSANGHWLNFDYVSYPNGDAALSVSTGFRG